MYRLIVLDVDGTILPIGPSTEPSAAVHAALTDAVARVHVALATGRSYAWSVDLIRGLGLPGPHVINGGSQIVYADGRVLWEAPLSTETVATLVSLIETGTTLIVNDGGEEILNPTHTSFAHPLAVKIQELDATSAVKYRSLLTQHDITYHENVSWKEGCVDLYITHRDATKKHAVEVLAAHLGISKEEIIAVGDGKNDIPLFEASGLKVAMGNAHNDLKSIADYIAPSVDEHGVAAVVEKFILS